RILRMDEIVVPCRRSLPRHLTAGHAWRERPREEAVDAERLHEAEVRVDAGDCVAVRGRAARLPRQEDRADVRIPEDVAPAAQNGVVVARSRSLSFGLNRHRADAVGADPPRPPAARDAGKLLAR